MSEQFPNSTAMIRDWTGLSKV